MVGRRVAVTVVMYHIVRTDGRLSQILRQTLVPTTHPRANAKSVSGQYGGQDPGLVSDAVAQQPDGRVRVEFPVHMWQSSFRNCTSKGAVQAGSRCSSTERCRPPRGPRRSTCTRIRLRRPGHASGSAICSPRPGPPSMVQMRRSRRPPLRSTVSQPSSTSGLKSPPSAASKTAFTFRCRVCRLPLTARNACTMALWQPAASIVTTGGCGRAGGDAVISLLLASRTAPGPASAPPAPGGAVLLGAATAGTRSSGRA